MNTQIPQDLPVRRANSMPGEFEAGREHQELTGKASQVTAAFVIHSVPGLVTLPGREMELLAETATCTWKEAPHYVRSEVGKLRLFL